MDSLKAEQLKAINGLLGKKLKAEFGYRLSISRQEAGRQNREHGGKKRGQRLVMEGIG